MHSRLLTASSAGIQGWVDRVRHLFSAVRHILGWHKEESGTDRSDIKHWQLRSADSVPTSILYPELTRATPILCFTPPWAHVQLEPEPHYYYYYSTKRTWHLSFTWTICSLLKGFLVRCEPELKLIETIGSRVSQNQISDSLRKKHCVHHINNY